MSRARYVLATRAGRAGALNLAVALGVAGGAVLLPDNGVRMNDGAALRAPGGYPTAPFKAGSKGRASVAQLSTGHAAASRSASGDGD